MAARAPTPPTNFVSNLETTLTLEGNNADEKNLHSKYIDKNTEGQEVESLLCSSYQCIEEASKKHSICNCTNISIMHLFHEMKQQFPTVPDPIVIQCVNNNCHDRTNCIINLRNELDVNPISVQAYPSKVLRNQQLLQNQKSVQNQQFKQEQKNSMCKKTLPQPNRTSATQYKRNNQYASLSNNLLNNNNNNNVSLKKNEFLSKHTRDLLKSTSSFLDNEQSSNSYEQTSVKYNYSDMPSLFGDNKNEVLSSELLSSQRITAPKRPTTLNLNYSPPYDNILKNQNQYQLHQKSRPLRKAPIPPIPPKPSQFITSSSPITSTTPITSAASICLDQSLSSKTSIATPACYSDSGESGISLNVSISPSTTASGTPTQRHRSVITVQPEAPYTRDFLSPSSQNSFTSVNLTLRQPGAASQSTIDISAGPGPNSGLTYSSTSYDARRGYKKNFLITVTDEGGIFSASRIRPRSCFYPSAQHSEEEFNVDQANLLRSATSEQNVLQNTLLSADASPLSLMNGFRGNMSLAKEIFCPEVLQRQENRKDKLATALRDNKKRLEQVQQEIKILTQPVNAGGSERLDSEIQRLRCDCQAMLNEIENSKRSGLSVNTIKDLNSINNRKQPFPRQRPPRPPPPRVPHNSVQQLHQSALLSPHLALQEQHHQADLLQFQTSRHRRIHQEPPPHNTSTDEDEFSDTNSVEESPMWACNMCTFRNHPLLNKCECCENVRIKPGTIRIVSLTSNNSAMPQLLSNAHTPTPPLLSHLPPGLTASSSNLVLINGSNGNSTDNETNLTPQFALHT